MVHFRRGVFNEIACASPDCEPFSHVLEAPHHSWRHIAEHLKLPGATIEQKVAIAIAVKDALSWTGITTISFTELADLRKRAAQRPSKRAAAKEDL